MKSILILFAHPRFEKSRTNEVLVRNIRNLEGVTFHDLYEQYPDFHIDVPYEKELLLQHDIIVWHHPLYWYNCPPLMKQWIDLVLEYDWAYGPKGNALQGKQCLQVVTTGGSKEVYCSEGSNLYSVNEFLRPFEQTARLCRMQYLPPYAVMGTHKISDEALLKHADEYQRIIECLRKDRPLAEMKNCTFQTDIPELNNIQRA